MIHFEMFPHWLIPALLAIVGLVCLLTVFQQLQKRKRRRERGLRRSRHLAHRRAWDWLSLAKRPRQQRLSDLRGQDQD